MSYIETSKILIIIKIIFLTKQGQIRSSFKKPNDINLMKYSGGN